MASQDQIETIIQAMLKLPSPVFKEIKETNSGIGAVLKLLHESKGYITAGDISKELGVSTARVAVLLKKMVKKGIITRQRAIIDGRVVVVRLTPLGEEIIYGIKKNLQSLTGKVIDEVGYQRLTEFIDTAKLINETVRKYKPSEDFLDKYLENVKKISR